MTDIKEKTLRWRIKSRLQGYLARGICWGWSPVVVRVLRAYITTFRKIDKNKRIAKCYVFIVSRNIKLCVNY